MNCFFIFLQLNFIKTRPKSKDLTNLEKAQNTQPKNELLINDIFNLILLKVRVSKMLMLC